MGSLAVLTDGGITKLEAKHKNKIARTPNDRKFLDSKQNTQTPNALESETMPNDPKPQIPCLP